MDTETIMRILGDYSTSDWLRRAYRELANRDAVDATADAELLAEIMRARLNILQPA